MEFLPAEIDAYAASHTAPEDAVLADLNRETWSKILRPRMLSGHIQGKILETFSYMIRPQKVLEIGTYTGYSAINLARGVQQGGKLYTIDINDEISYMARNYVERAGLSQVVNILVGDAMQIIPTLHETWDLVFIDADKENYSHYFHMVLPHMRKGAFIIADNVLWSGKITDPVEDMDEETRSLHEFNQMVHAHPGVENVLFPVRDGLMVMRVL